MDFLPEFLSQPCSDLYCLCLLLSILPRKMLLQSSFHASKMTFFSKSTLMLFFKKNQINAERFTHLSWEQATSRIGPLSPGRLEKVFWKERFWRFQRHSLPSHPPLSCNEKGARWELASQGSAPFTPLSPPSLLSYLRSLKAVCAPTLSLLTKWRDCWKES